MSITHLFGRLFHLVYQFSISTLTAPARLRVMVEYARVRFRVLLHGRILGKKPGAEKVFGYTVFPDSYPLFGMLVSEIFVIREYEFKAERARPLIIDCGGNIGLSTIYFAMQNPDARILTFEPSPGTFERLQKMKDLNQLQNVELHAVALSEKEGEIDFYLPQDDDASVVATKYADFGTGGRKVRVRAARLSGYISERVDFLKIDIEGAEGEVLRELAASSKISLVDRIALEYHHHHPLGRDEFSLILKTLEDSGFGYVIHAPLPRPVRSAESQAFMVYAYRKG